MKNGITVWAAFGAIVSIILFIFNLQAGEIKQNRSRIDTLQDQLKEFEIQLTKIETILTIRFKEEAKQADSIIKVRRDSTHADTTRLSGD